MEKNGNERREILMQKIEDISLTIFKQIMNDELPELFVSRKRDWTTANSASEKDKLCTRGSTIRFSSRRSVIKFGSMMKLLSAVYSLLVQNQYCTKRDLYYQNPDLYGNQRYVDQLIDSLSSMLKVPRWHLHVVATSKGLLSGDLTFLDSAGKMIDCSNSKNGILLPSLIHKVTLINSTAQFIIVIEKDATFQHLLEENVFDALGSCILITAKGYPDVNTRILLNMISVKFPKIPMYALVDADPHGVSIYLTYKFGSLTLAHDVQNLAIPNLQWLGVLPSNIEELQIPKHVAIELSMKERVQVQDIMNRSYMKNLSFEMNELQTMLEKNKKIEIQSLDAFNRSYLLHVYLPYRLNKLRHFKQAA